MLSNTDCRLCLGPHDPDIHAATERIHAWFRERVTRELDMPPRRP